MPRISLSDADEKRLAETIVKLYPDQPEKQAAATTYGRKLIKHAKGLRATAAPVPGQLQQSSRAATHETCVEIATALGLDLAKVGLEEGESAAPGKRREARPDPKPAGRRREKVA